LFPDRKKDKGVVMKNEDKQILVLTSNFENLKDVNKDKIVPIELQGTWVSSQVTSTITGSSVIVKEANGVTNTGKVKSVKKGDVVTMYGTDYTVYYITYSTAQWPDDELALSQDGNTLIDGHTRSTFHKE
jgi:hypothetical protein